MTPPTAHEEFLRALAVAVVQQPRATLQELASAVGVSKATLYRFCRTREQLIATLCTFCMERVTRIIDELPVDAGPPLTVLRHLIEQHLANREFTAFLFSYWEPATHPEHVATWEKHQQFMDALILRGQRDGVFRIDISAAAMADCFGILLCGLEDSERRGRIPRAGLARTVERLFLEGARAAP